MLHSWFPIFSPLPHVHVLERRHRFEPSAGYPLQPKAWPQMGGLLLDRSSVSPTVVRRPPLWYEIS